MNMTELIYKLIPITPNERKCALDKTMRDKMRESARVYLNQWYQDGCIEAIPAHPKTT